MNLPLPSFKFCSTALVALALLSAPKTLLAQRPLGTDVSGYQTSINWATVKNAGVAFAWSKATEGTGYVNPYFVSQENGAKGVGIYIGAYHFARPSAHPNVTGANSADTEAAYFWSVAGPYVQYSGGYLVPMLDWEDPNVTNQLSATTMSAWVNEWCNSISNYARAAGILGLRPVVYTGTWYSRPSSTYSGLTTTVTNWPSWIAAYPTNPNIQGGGPSDTYPWPTWNIWQYADTNWSGGDADVFNGNLTGFVQMFGVGGTNGPTITTQPSNVNFTLGTDATLSVRATSAAPVSFQWYHNGVLIPGATSSNWVLSNIQWSDAGGYNVSVGNSNATVGSKIAYVGVIAPATNSPGSILAPPGVVNWWPADANANDVFGNLNATPHNNVTYVAGKRGRAFRFDGLTGYLTTGASSIPVPWTASMWVNRQNAPGTAAAISGDGNFELKLEQYNLTRQVGFTIFGVNDYNFGYSVPQNTWTHLAFVASGTQMQLYANGSLVGTITTNIPCPRAYIGTGYVSSGSRLLDFMTGNLDEIMLFNRALSVSQISALATAGSAGIVWAPEFTGEDFVGPNKFGLSLRGLTGKNVKIYSSPDFSAWTQLSTVPNPTGIINFTDNSATNDVMFYRAIQP
jgi:GH25 family lysozyme M1 (1,4-beta-N-acetylmuramidase)